MPFFDSSDGTRIFYTDTGQGRPVLMLHGWSCDGNDWSWQTPELEKEYRVITVDHRGHGRSDAPAGSYRSQVLADDAAALLEAVAPGREAIIFGHSMGTVVASALTIRHPGLAAGLVLVDPVYHYPDEPMKPTCDALRGPAPAAVAAELFDALFYTPDTPPFLKAWHRRRILATPDHVIAGCFLGLYEGEEGIGRAVIARDYLRQRTVPRLAVYAGEPAAEFERSLPAGEHDEIRILEGGHFLHQHKAGEFNRLAFDWLRRLPG